MKNIELADPTIKDTKNTYESMEEKVARLEEENKQLRDQLIELQQNAFFDPLTSLGRKEFFLQQMERYFQNTESSNLKTGDRRNKIEMPVVSLIIFDIDKFKDVNDTLGHSGGDVVLRKVSEIIQEHVRENDITGRWGGEEMVLAMIGADEKVATNKADLIREKISQIEFPEFPNLKLTISAGVASSDKFDEFVDFFNAADKALYQSKNSGRNRVTAHSGVSE